MSTMSSFPAGRWYVLGTSPAWPLPLNQPVLLLLPLLLLLSPLWGEEPSRAADFSCGELAAASEVVMRPTDTPAVRSERGMPAACSAKLPAHTAAIDDDLHGEMHFICKFNPMVTNDAWTIEIWGWPQTAT